ncbi:hypothetical protein DFP93_101291 [Aneurinibacillus soli]|uniref:Uncharacterized protein n=1 Tax=Aneurinibacillus soli TaxID=1500254 RepID=A0A0U5B9F1_9BACL|nr:hypothetical protein DFP93_101291 [Aneurinibacillus soli]BAU28214.1 hypothetical protein CB4_02388 [Aneurinibacillus soli]
MLDLYKIIKENLMSLFGVPFFLLQTKTLHLAGLNTLLHAALSAFSKENRILHRAFEMGVTTIITAATNRIRVLFVVVNNGCVITFVFLVDFSQCRSPSRWI